MLNMKQQIKKYTQKKTVSNAMMARSNFFVEQFFL